MLSAVDTRDVCLENDKTFKVKPKEFCRPNSLNPLTAIQLNSTVNRLETESCANYINQPLQP